MKILYGSGSRCFVPMIVLENGTILTVPRRGKNYEQILLRYI